MIVCVLTAGLITQTPFYIWLFLRFLEWKKIKKTGEGLWRFQVYYKSKTHIKGYFIFGLFGLIAWPFLTMYICENF